MFEVCYDPCPHLPHKNFKVPFLVLQHMQHITAMTTGIIKHGKTMMVTSTSVETVENEHNTRLWLYVHTCILLHYAMSE